MKKVIGRNSLLVLVCLSIVQGVSADGPCDAAKFHDFDFWIGNWSVAIADGTHAGQNTITVEQGGCVLVENWKGAKGGTGQSMNYFDTFSNSWRQLWISPGVQIDYHGGLVDGSMHLVGRIHYLANGDEFPFRGTWTLLPDGRVRQFFEESREEGKWNTWFEGFYTAR